jgi:branched-chain amino acid transport system substrate-binding protein
MMARSLASNLENIGARSIYTVGMDDSLGHQYHEALNNALPGNVSEEGAVFPPPDQTDYTVPIERALDSGADSVTMLHFPNIVPFLNQVEESGAWDEFDNIIGIWNHVAFGQQASRLDGFYAQSNYWWSMDRAQNNDFVQSYQNEYNNVPDTFAAFTYDYGRMYLEGVIETGGTDSDELVEFLDDFEQESSLKGTSQSFRDCDRHMEDTLLLLRGKAEANRERAADIMTVENEVGPENSLPDCFDC